MDEVENNNDELCSIIDITSTMLYEISDDAEECVNYLIEYPERCAYFWCVKKSKLSMIFVECAQCNKILTMPSRIVYHCIKNRCCGNDYCVNCYHQTKCKEFYIDDIYDVYHRFHIDIHNESNMKIENKVIKDIQEFVKFCSPVRDINEEIKEKELSKQIIKSAPECSKCCPYNIYCKYSH